MSMISNNKKILDYWNKKEVESMYDKHLINAEIKLIKSNIPKSSKILDAGCGEGEGTYEYSNIEGCLIEAVDFSEMRLKKAKKKLKKHHNVTFKKIDFLSSYSLDKDFDIIISQRFIINLIEWELQKKVIIDLMNHLKPGGLFLMLEGYKEGVDDLNRFRNLFNLPDIPIKWHNLFLEDDKILNLLSEEGFKLISEYGLGEYFLLTRGIRPYFDTELDWNVDFNKIASNINLKDMLNFNSRFSRLKLWVLSK